MTSRRSIAPASTVSPAPQTPSPSLPSYSSTSSSASLPEFQAVPQVFEATTVSRLESIVDRLLTAHTDLSLRFQRIETLVSNSPLVAPVRLPEPPAQPDPAPAAETREPNLPTAHPGVDTASSSSSPRSEYADPENRYLNSSGPTTSSPLQSDLDGSALAIRLNKQLLFAAFPSFELIFDPAHPPESPVLRSCDWFSRWLRRALLGFIDYTPDLAEVQDSWAPLFARLSNSPC